MERAAAGPSQWRRRTMTIPTTTTTIHTYTHTYTHTHTLSLSLTHTHTHTHHAPIPVPQLLHRVERDPHRDEPRVVQVQELVGGIGVQSHGGDFAPLLGGDVDHVLRAEAVPVAALVLKNEEKGVDGMCVRWGGGDMF